MVEKCQKVKDEKLVHGRIFVFDIVYIIIRYCLHNYFSTFYGRNRLIKFGNLIAKHGLKFPVKEKSWIILLKKKQKKVHENLRE